MRPGCTDFFGKLDSVNIWWTSDGTRYHHLRRYPSTSGFGDGCIPIYIVNYDLRCWTTFRHIILRCTSWDLIQVRRFKPCVIFYLRSAAFPPAQLNYFLRLSSFVNEPFRSKAQKLLAQVLHKRALQVPTTMTQLLLPPLHVRDWKAKLGTWLQRWVASHRSLFRSLFLSKIRVVETRSATLGDRIYNYRKWQQRWTPDTSFVHILTLLS